MRVNEIIQDRLTLTVNYIQWINSTYEMISNWTTNLSDCSSIEPEFQLLYSNKLVTMINQLDAINIKMYDYRSKIDELLEFFTYNCK